jgi:hypothetical protein
VENQPVKESPKKYNNPFAALLAEYNIKGAKSSNADEDKRELVPLFKGLGMLIDGIQS